MLLITTFVNRNVRHWTSGVFYLRSASTKSLLQIFTLFASQLSSLCSLLGDRQHHSTHSAVHWLLPKVSCQGQNTWPGLHNPPIPKLTGNGWTPLVLLIWKAIDQNKPGNIFSDRALWLQWFLGRLAEDGLELAWSHPKACPKKLPVVD